MIQYVVQYKVHEYEHYSGPHREEIFADLPRAIKRRNRINRYITRQNDERMRYLGHAYDRRSDELHRAMTDHCSFIYTSPAKVIERTIEEREIA